MQAPGGVVGNEDCAFGGNESGIDKGANAVGAVIKGIEWAQLKNTKIERPVLYHEMAEAKPGCIVQRDGCFDEGCCLKGGCKRDLVIGGTEGEGEGGGFGICEGMRGWG